MKKLMVLLALCISSAAFAQHVNINIDLGGNQDATIQVNQNGMVVTFGSSKIARKRVQMLPGTLRIGSRVVTKAGGYSGTVAGINPVTKQLSVNISGLNYNYSLSDVAVTNGCNEVFCVDEIVITNNGYTGRVAGFFSDGTVAVTISGLNYNYTADQLAITDACSSFYCTGDTVITSVGGYTGTVAGIFGDGTIAVNISGLNYNYAMGTLSVTKAICANIYLNRVGICY